MIGSISVLYINPTKQLRAGIKALSQGLGSDMDIVIFTPSESEQTISQFPNVSYEYYNACYIPKIRYTLPTISFWKRLREQVRHADIVHAYSYFYPVCALTAIEAAYTHTPYIITVDSLPGVNWSSGNRHVDKIGRLYTETIGSMTLSSADRIVALGEYLDAALNNYTRPTKRTIIPNGIDISRFHLPETQPTPKEYVDLLFVGRLDPVKGVGYLLQALKILPKIYRLTIVGDGTRKSMYKQQCRKLGIDDRVQFEGYQSNVSQYYQDHDLFVLPSLSEGQPTVLMEAQACGTPVISTEVGGVKSLIQEGEIVPPKKPRALANAIKSFDLSKSDLEEDVRSHIIENYSMDRMCDDYKRLYYEVLKHG